MRTRAGRQRQALGIHPVARVLLPFAGAYVLSYLYRSINAVIAADLSADFALSAAQLGLLTSAYLLAFAAFQLPLGLLLDRFGPRRTDASLLLIAALGALIFALADRLPSLIVGRALIGLGVSGCLMSGIKANVVWFPLSRLAAMNGWLFFAGGVGLMLATLPVEIAVRLTHWQTVFGVLAMLTVTASALIFFVVPERAGEAVRETMGAQLRGLWRVFCDHRFWQIALSATAMQSTHMAVQGLWAGPWLRDVAGLGRDAVAWHLLLMACSAAAGFLFWGNFATWLSRRGISTLGVFIWKNRHVPTVPTPRHRRRWRDGARVLDRLRILRNRGQPVLCDPAASVSDGYGRAGEYSAQLDGICLRVPRAMGAGCGDQPVAGDRGRL
jgi:MFS family permease